MADLKAYTSVFAYPYPLSGDEISNIPSRVQELAERVEAVNTALGLSGVSYSLLFKRLPFDPLAQPRILPCTRSFCLSLSV